MYAVIVTGGKQFKVSAGDVLEVEKLEGEVGSVVEFPAIMTVDGETVAVGSDVTAKVRGEIVKQGKSKKVVVFKYKAKKNERVKNGHRQAFTKVKITEITEHELLLENLIKAVGYEDVVVTIGMNSDNVNIIVKCAELTLDDTIKIYTIVEEEGVSTVENIKIIPIS